MASKIDENIEKKLNDFYETYCHFESEINILQSYENSDYGMSKEDYKRMTFMQYLL